MHVQRSPWLLTLAVAAAALAQPPLAVREDLYGIWLQEGSKRQQDGRWEAAVVCYRRALEYRPGGGEALYGLGVSLAHTGKIREAEQSLRQLLAVNPSHAGGSLLLGRLLRSRGAAREAAEVLRAALARRPADAALAKELGGALLQTGSAAQALSPLHQALASGRDDYEVRLLLGRCYATLGDAVHAGEHLSKALALKPHDPTAALHLLEVYLGAGRWLEALNLSQTQVGTHPTDRRFWWAMARAALSLAEATKAMQAVTEAIRLTPRKEQRNAVLRAAKMGLAADLPEVTLAAVKTVPRPDAELLAYRAKAAEALDRWVDAAGAWELAAAARSDLLAEAARCWLIAGEKARALACLDRLGQKEPMALAEAARLALSMGREEEAECYARRLLAMMPNKPDLHLNVAELLARRGDLGEAAGQAHEAARQAPGQAARVLGTIYLRGGQWEAAADAYLRAWEHTRSVEDAQSAARLLRELGQYERLNWLLQNAGKHTEALRLEAAWLALRQRTPDRALEFAKGIKSPEAAEVRAEAAYRLGLADAVTDAVEALRGQQTDTDRILCILRGAEAADSETRQAALERLLTLVKEGVTGQNVMEALDVLFEIQYGNRGKLEQWIRAAQDPKTSPALVQEAARRVSDSGQPEAARALIDARLKTAAGPSAVQIRLLGLAAYLSLQAESYDVAAEYLMRAAALRGQPAVISCLTVLRHGGSWRTAVVDAMRGLAQVWETGGNEAEALLNFMACAADEANVEAWAASYEGSPEDRAVLDAERALSKGQPDVALIKLQRARPSPPIWQREAEALLRLGRQAEAEKPAAKLLRYRPGVEAFSISGATAAQGNDWQAAAWWYARAFAAGGDDVTTTAALARAAEMSGMNTAARRALAEGATAYAVTASARSRALRSLLVALGVSESSQSGESP